MHIELPYLIRCESVELQNILIKIFKQWSEDLNQRLLSIDNKYLTPLEITVYQMEELYGKIEIDSAYIYNQEFIDNELVNNFLKPPVVVNGISIRIDDFGGFHSSELSLVFPYRENSV